MITAIDYASQIVYGSRQTLEFTVKVANEFKNKPGVWCELGVAAGAHIIGMMSVKADNKIYAFDSFCGLPLPSNRDNQMPGIRELKEWEQKALPDPGKQKLETTGATSVSLGDFWHHIDTVFGPRRHNVTAIEGWFEQTLPLHADTIEPISILRLDSDLFYSTWICLQYLFPRVIKGGCVIIDDIELPGCKSAVEEYFELIDYQPNYQYVSNICYFYK